MRYKVYYNEDCQKYGIQALKADISYKGDKPRWTQILIYKNKEVAPFQINGKYVKCYTPYRGVAQRWLKELTA